MTIPAAAPSHADELDVFECPLDGIRLIEASAGTGKTWNICGLFLRLLVERELPVDAILVVTFTRAATAELKSRVRERIAGTLAYLDGTAADGDPFVAQLVAALEARAIARAQIRERLDLALQTFDEAAIFTIHGYCQRALADTPFAAALPFALELAEDDLELRLEVTRDFWRREIASDDCPAELGELLIARGDSPERWAALLGRYLARPLAQKRWPGAGGEGKPDLASVRAAFADACALWNGNGREAHDALLKGLPGLSATSYKADAVALAAKNWTSWLAGGDPLAPLDVQDGKFALFSATRLDECVKKHCSAPQHPFFDAAARVLALRDEVIAALDLLLTGI